MKHAGSESWRKEDRDVLLDPLGGLQYQPGKGRSGGNKETGGKGSRGKRDEIHHCMTPKQYWQQGSWQGLTGTLKREKE